MSIALLIDGNTIESEYVNSILTEALNNGKVVVKKAYGKFGSSKVAYRKLLVDASFYIEETMDAHKGKIASELLAEMAALTHESNIEEIHIATKDAYIMPFVRMAVKNGKRVVVYGSNRASVGFVKSCTEYKYLDVIAGRNDELGVTDIEVISKCVLDIVVAKKAQGKGITGKEVNEHLKKLYPDFDIRNYGYTHFETFVRANIKGVQLLENDNDMVVKLIDDKKDVETFIYTYLADRKGKVDDMDEIENALYERFADFSTVNYGFTSFMAFLLSFPKLIIFDNKGVKLRQSFKLK